MKKLLSLLAFSLACFAQTGTLTPTTATAPPAAGYAPGAVIPVNITKSGNSTATGIQFDIQAGAGVASVALSLPASLASAKQVSCSIFSPNFTCVIVGLNAATIPDGIIATANVTLATAGLTSPVTVTVANPVETDATGTALAVTVANPTLSFSIRNLCDVTGDGNVSSSDLSVLINAAIAKAAAPDLNSDGKVNVQDAQIVATATVGPTFTCNAH